MITEKIPMATYLTAGGYAGEIADRDTKHWFDIRNAIAEAIMEERKESIEKLNAVEASELSLLWRGAYTNHVRSILTMGETEVPPSIHFAASEFASGELKARLIDAIEGA